MTRYKRLKHSRAAIDVQFTWVFGIQIVKSTFGIHLCMFCVMIALNLFALCTALFAARRPV